MTVSALVWADAEPLVTLTGCTLEEAEEAVVNASWVLWALTGRKLHNAGQREETWRLTPGGRREIYLRGPGPEVIEILRTDPWDLETEDTVLEPGDNYALVGTTLHLRGVGGCGVLTIVYDVCSNLPPMADLAALALAEQFIYAAQGSGKCKLPSRITSITRDGVSWSVLDPMDFLEKGLTGLERVDDFLRIVNPMHNRQRARILDAAQPRRVKGRWL